MSKLILEIEIDSEDLEPTERLLDKRFISYRIKERRVFTNEEKIDIIYSLFDEDLMLNKNKHNIFSEERKMFHYVSWIYTDAKLFDISFKTRNCDKSTVLYSKNIISNLLFSDKKIIARVKLIRNICKYTYGLELSKRAIKNGVI